MRIPYANVHQGCDWLVKDCKRSDLYPLHYTAAILVGFLVAMLAALGGETTMYAALAVFVAGAYAWDFHLTRRAKKARAYRHILRRIRRHAKACSEFNDRMAAVYEYASKPGAGQPEEGVMNKFMDEYQALERESWAIEQDRQKLEREFALKKMKQALTAAPNQGQYRETRDIADLVYLNTELNRENDTSMARVLDDGDNQERFDAELHASETPIPPRRSRVE